MPTSIAAIKISICSSQTPFFRVNSRDHKNSLQAEIRLERKIFSLI